MGGDGVAHGWETREEWLYPSLKVFFDGVLGFLAQRAVQRPLFCHQHQVCLCCLDNLLICDLLLPILCMFMTGVVYLRFGCIWPVCCCPHNRHTVFLTDPAGSLMGFMTFICGANCRQKDVKVVYAAAWRPASSQDSLYCTQTAFCVTRFV